MAYAICCSSQTGNTRMLADVIRDALPGSGCVYAGVPCEKALTADTIYVGFWTDKGQCDEDTAAFLKTMTDQRVFLFGTAGFGGSPDYYNQILDRTASFLPDGVQVAGRFMCQGKMRMEVRRRYEKLLESPNPPAQIRQMIQNFDLAMSHPNEEDLNALRLAFSL